MKNNTSTTDKKWGKREKKPLIYNRKQKSNPLPNGIRRTETRDKKIPNYMQLLRKEKHRKKITKNK